MVPKEEIVMKIQALLKEKKKNLALAESCTGGFLSHLITSVPGSSGYFLGSFVVYSNELKQSILGVKSETLENQGAVSQQTVEEMAQGVFRATRADFSIAISGVAGPEGGTEKTPVGTVWIAIAERGKKTESHCLFFIGNRSDIISESAYKSLSLLYCLISD